MAMAGLLIVCLLLVGCVSNTVNMSVGEGGHTLGPKTDKKSQWESSKDSQENTDAITEMSNRVSGIDKSTQKLHKDIKKTSQTQQDIKKRNEAVDRVNPELPRETRKSIYD